ncbi:Epimerase family protein [compost metagenome]
MAKNILITGGSGLVGKRLTTILQEKGYNVGWLSRSDSAMEGNIKVFNWDIPKEIIDEAAIEFADVIISLAGAGIADKHWSDKRKEEIIHSRVDGINLLYSKVKNSAKKLDCFVSASAVGYYGDRDNELLNESAPPTNEFLSLCCQKWERAADKFNQLSIRTVKIRTGMVLDKNEGALPQITKPIKLGLGAALGTGKQWISWIHIDDLCRLYITAFENNTMIGVYNACSPLPVTNTEFTKTVAATLKKKLWLPNVPAFALKLVLGEMSKIVLDSTKCSANKTIQTGFKFEYGELSNALQAIYR